MRTMPGPLKTWLDSNSVSYFADTYLITLLDGSTIYRWTSADVDLVISGQTFRSQGANGPLIQRGSYNQSARLTVDTLDLTLVGGVYLIGGKTLPQLAVQGYFDGARVQVDHLIGPDLPGALALGVLPKFFEGRVAAMDPNGAQVALQLKSELESLNVLLPRFMLQPACGNAVYDANCGLVRATFTIAGTATGGTTTTVTSTSAAIIAKATGYFDLGVLAFTSGALNGSRRAVKASVLATGVTTFTMALPFASAPANGDTFTVYPGCHRDKNDCGASKFNNLAQHRGYSHIPTSEAGA
jgi:uncharacterized phage protein (TIGR02218 family)